MGLLDARPSEWLPMDSGSRVTIDRVHHEIHEGEHFTAYRYESVGATSAVSILLTAPASGEMHVTGALLADGAGIFTWSEAPNASGGTAITPRNNKRSSTTAATLGVTHTPTYVSAGTVLIESHVGTYAPSVNVGGQFANRQEWILAPSTLYLIRFVADGASCRTAIVVEWYEED